MAALADKSEPCTATVAPMVPMKFKPWNGFSATKDEKARLQQTDRPTPKVLAIRPPRRLRGGGSHAIASCGGGSGQPRTLWEVFELAILETPATILNVRSKQETVHFQPRRRRPAPYFRKACCRRFASHLAGIQPLLANSRTCIEGPFGEVIRSTGPMARNNPFRFSTKYDDDESDLLYYGKRYYEPSTGTWPSRDPLGEPGFELLAQRPKTCADRFRQRIQAGLDWLQALDPRLASAMKSGLVRMGIDVWRPQDGENIYDFVNDDPVDHIDSFGLTPPDNSTKCCTDKVPDAVKDLLKQAADNLASLAEKSKSAQIVRVLLLASDAKKGCGDMMDAANKCHDFAKQEAQDPGYAAGELDCELCCHAIMDSFPGIAGLNVSICHGLCADF